MNVTTYKITDNFLGDDEGTTITAFDEDIPATILRAMHQSGEQPEDIEEAIAELAADISRGGTLEARTRDIATGLGLRIERI